MGGWGSGGANGQCTGSYPVHRYSQTSFINTVMRTPVMRVLMERSLRAGTKGTACLKSWSQYHGECHLFPWDCR